MKKAILYILFVCLFTSVSFATYTHTITEYQILPNLYGTESMLITGQGGGGLTYLSDNSSLTIESTSTLGQGTGGVWEIHPGGNSSLYMTGGQVHEIAIINNATAYLSGGLIQQIWSQQIAWKLEDNPPVPVWNPHITIVYSGTLPTLQTIYGLPHLVGTWGDGTDFSIYLPNIQGYSPAMQNIRFELIPEPVTLSLLGLGILLLRRRAS